MKMILLLTFVVASLTTLVCFAVTPKKVVTLTVTDKGFEPKQIDVAPGTDVTLNITRTSDSTCATEIQIPDKKVKKALPLNKTVQIALGILPQGEIRFGCGMNMMESGKIEIK